MFFTGINSINSNSLLMICLLIKLILIDLVLLFFNGVIF
ncbi:hypothetical protein KKH3_16240 [Pectobacterium actinidiae]|nr:hypothetical protein KKH3_16240 [Pectobacterium actinidiae]